MPQRSSVPGARPACLFVGNPFRKIEQGSACRKIGEVFKWNLVNNQIANITNGVPYGVELGGCGHG